MITYNNKDILKSFIGNKRVVRKYLNNKIVYGIPDFAQYYNIQGYDNYEVVGNPTITEGMVSNFSRINYITVPAFSPFNNTWKIVTKFKLTDTTTNQIIFSNNYQPNKQIQLSVQNSKLKVYISTNGTSSNLASGVFGTATILADTVYWVKFEFTRNAYIVSYSLNGISWTPDIIINSTETLINVSNNIFFGKNTNPNYPEPLTNGSIIYLNDTYIEVNGKYWFNGNSNYKELLDCNSNVYLQSSGTQYIDSGIYANSNLSNELVINFNGNNGQRLFGARKAYLQDAFALFYSKMLASTYGTSDLGYTIPFTKNIKNTIYRNKNKVFVNDLLLQTDPDQSFTTTYSLYLFTVNQSGSVLTPNASSTKIYLSKIWNNEELVQHLVPVPEGLQIGSYKVPSNGMFDIVTQTFYENKGSGEFIWGIDS